jgi:hypothetical protein
MRPLIVASALLAVGTLFAAEPTGEPILIEQPRAFKTLVNPNCSHCRDEAKSRGDELKPDDRVLCWIRGYSDGGVIPFRFFLNEYRVISDTYGVFVHDPDAGFARGFAPSLDFQFHGWRNGVMVMRHKDGTLYSCLTGIAFAGPRKGDKLKPKSTLVSNWGFWLDRYPQAVAYKMMEEFKPVALPAEEAAGSKKSRAKADPRLKADQFVLGVAHGKDVRAYPLDALEKAGLIEDKLDDKDCVILWYGPTKTAAAYQRLALHPMKETNRRVTLSRDDKNKAAPFVDHETSSRWDVSGRAVEGELKGWQLQWLDGVQVKWFAWAAEYPKTTIHGK